ncbi:MAG TPA: DUF1570 domain-containing protein [Pirellulales bacterium]|jgi:hypothetical protein|nr:DUF1570 domain-containing protein [Pirellulales bacterium]
MHVGAPRFRFRFLCRLAGALAICAAVCGCATWHTAPKSSAELPERFTVALDQLLIHSNFEIPSQHRLLQEINAERVDISSQLNLPISDEKIHVYLFKEPEQFYEFIRLKYPNFPDRRAFFIETDTKLSVYAYWGDRVAEDLRHEVCHGYLHSMVQNLPLWLDEGLAKYFEVPRGTHGMNSTLLVELDKQAKQGRWRPDIRRLEALRSPAEMTECDYAEAWSWVHWLLETDPAHKSLLQEYLTDLRRTGTPTPLSLYVRRLPGDPEHQLFDYIVRLQGGQ